MGVLWLVCELVCMCFQVLVLLGLLKLNGFWKCLWMCRCLWLVIFGLLFMFRVIWWIWVLFIDIGCSIWKKDIDMVMLGNRFRLKLVLCSECMMWCICFGGMVLESFLVMWVKCFCSCLLLLFIFRFMCFGIMIMMLWLLFSEWVMDWLLVMKDSILEVFLLIDDRKVLCIIGK